MISAAAPQLHIAVCDDDDPDCRQIARLAGEILDGEGFSCTISTYASSTELLDVISSGTEFSVLLLDVLMEELDGMELAARLREQKKRTAIIFISCNREMALRGYEVDALRYLAKPLDRERLREALLCFCQRQLEQRDILLPTADGQRRISLPDILFAETWGRGVRLAMTSGQVEINLKISELAAILPQREFVLCHRTILVNLSHVQSIRHCELELTTGDVLPVSKYRQRTVEGMLLRYLDA